LNATITRPPRRIAVSWGLIRAGVYLAFHRKVTLPGYSGGLPLQVSLDGTCHDERVAELEALAEAMGVQVTRRNGIMQAVRRFGPVRIRASVCDASYTRQFRAVRDSADTAAEREMAA
jgi:hypothetical protein